MLTYGELFAGVGGFGQGFNRAGMSCRWQVEIDPWCQQILRRHWPDVPLHADVREVGAHNLEPVDVISFGSPCQDLSVAGNRAGLIGERSGLFHEAARVIGELHPTYAVWENVPGALSSNGGRDFGAILDALADRGAVDICWRILDARFFGVPQRRRRLFVVASFRAGASAHEILVEPQSCGGHPQTRREERQDVAYALNASVRGTGDGHGNAWNSNYVAGSLQQSSLAGKGTFGYDEDPDVLKPVKTQSAGQMIVIGSQIDEGAARPRDQRASGYRMDMESETFVVASPVRASDGHHGYSSGRGDGADNLIAQTVSASYAKTTASGGSHGSQAPVNVVHGPMGVRRLTPREAERLQGWADDWTRYTADGKEIPDSHRYRCIGNGVVAPVAEWIGQRLVRADAW